MEKINQYLLFKPWLKKISEGSFFRNVFVWFIRLIACFQVIGLLVVSYKLW